MTKTEVYSKRYKELVDELDDVIEYAQVLGNPSTKVYEKAVSIATQLGNLRVPSNKQISI